MEDSNIKNFVKKGLYQKAPAGMMDRIMANLAVSPARRLSVKPVEPKPVFAVLVPLLIMVFLVLGFFLKPASLLPKSWRLTIDIAINPIWAAPVIVVALAVWTYIFIAGRQESKT